MAKVEKNDGAHAIEREITLTTNHHESNEQTEMFLSLNHKTISGAYSLSTEHSAQKERQILSGHHRRAEQTRQKGRKSKKIVTTLA